MDLISKKDLLAQTGISYGQLYRWKRQKLIPEDWFIKQSSYTGQETFFPKEPILSRVQAILDAKDAYSLDELANLFSPETAPLTLRIQQIEAFEEIDQTLLSSYQTIHAGETYNFFDLVWLASFSQTLRTLNLDESRQTGLIQICSHAALNIRDITASYTVFETAGGFSIVFSENDANLRFDSGVRVLDFHSMQKTAEALKLKYKETLVHPARPE